MDADETQNHHGQGRARHSVRAVIDDRATGGPWTARLAKKSVSIRPALRDPW